VSSGPPGAASSTVHTLTVPSSLAGERLDAGLAKLVPELSRARVQHLLEGGRVLLDGRAPKPSTRLRGGEAVRIEVPPPEPTDAVPQDLPLAVLFEDAELVVLDKAPGMVVHPARGSPHSTVVNAFMHRLTGPEGALPRLGLAHRLDKDTSGCLAVARTERALTALQAQFKARTVEKTYLALVHGAPDDEGRLDTPYGRHPGDRKRFTGRVAADRRAVTGWKVKERFGERAALLEVRLETGRTHQIRVHLAEAGFPLLADAVYGGARKESRLPAADPVRVAAEAIGRQALHAWKLEFDHPRTGKRVRLEAPLPADLARSLAVLRAAKL